MFEPPIKIKNNKGAEIHYELKPWPATHAIEMLRRLGPLLQGALATAGAIMAKTADTDAAKHLTAWVTKDGPADFADLDTFGVFSEISSKAGGDIASAVGWIVDVLRDENDSDLFRLILIGTTRRTKGGDDGHTFTRDDTSLATFDRVYAANLVELLAACTHILKLNFADFFTMGNDPAPSTAGEQVEGATLAQPNKPKLAKKRRSLAK